MYLSIHYLSGLSDSKPVADMYSKCWTCMESRGLIDIETTMTLKSLLDISGPHHFVQNMVKVSAGFI